MTKHIINDLNEISKNLKVDKQGIWRTNNKGRAISFPADVHEAMPELEKFSFWFQHRKRAFIEVLKNFPPLGTIFDIGGGNGFMSEAMLDEGYPVYLVEPTESGALNSLKRGLKNRVVLSTLNETGFHPGSLPSASLFDVLEHVEDDHEFLESLNSLLMPEGRLYITVPAYNMIWSDKDDFAGHYRRYTLSKLRELLLSTGFTLDYQTYLFSMLPIPVFFLRTIPRLFRKHPRNNYLQGRKKEHIQKTGFASSLMTAFLRREEKRVVRKKTIVFGATCFVVAKKEK